MSHHYALKRRTPSPQYLLRRMRHSPLRTPAKDAQSLGGLFRQRFHTATCGEGMWGRISLRLPQHLMGTPEGVGDKGRNMILKIRRVKRPWACSSSKRLQHTTLRRQGSGRAVGRVGSHAYSHRHRLCSVILQGRQRLPLTSTTRRTGTTHICTATDHDADASATATKRRERRLRHLRRPRLLAEGTRRSRIHGEHHCYRWPHRLAPTSSPERRLRMHKYAL